MTYITCTTVWPSMPSSCSSSGAHQSIFDAPPCFPCLISRGHIKCVISKWDVHDCMAVDAQFLLFDTHARIDIVHTHTHPNLYPSMVKRSGWINFVFLPLFSRGWLRCVVPICMCNMHAICNVHAIYSMHAMCVARVACYIKSYV